MPYFSWKYSHARHHKNTGSVEKDEVFVPETKPQVDESWHWRATPVGRFLTIGMTLTIGWPLYLLTNIAGRPYPRWANHFDPFSPIFTPSQRWQIVASDVGVAGMIGVLVQLGRVMGSSWVVHTYLVPYLMVNMWLVLITLLQVRDERERGGRHLAAGAILSSIVAHHVPITISLSPCPCSTPTLPCPTTLMASGTGCAALSPPWIAATVSWTFCITTLPILMCVIISLAPCLTTTRRRRRGTCAPC